MMGGIAYMRDAVPLRFEPKNMPDDRRDESLRRAALWLNGDDDIPAVFSDESLAYLDDLAYSSEGTGGSETESRAPETFAWYHRTYARRPKVFDLETFEP
jgi:hypothetical protein